MKKRVLSLLLACFMVITSVIIALPHKHAHAASAPVEGTDQWTLSGSSSEFNKNNNFAIKAYELTSYPKNNVNASMEVKSGWSYEAKAGNKDNSYHGGTFVKYKSDNNGKLSVWVSPISYNVGIEFTAPSDGFYSYEEVVKMLKGYDNRSGRGWQLHVVFSVIKNGIIFDSYVTENTDALNCESTLEGVIPMKKGEVLQFVAQKEHGNIDTWTPKDLEASIESLVVTRVGDLPENYATTSYVPTYDPATSTSPTSGPFTLKAISHSNAIWDTPLESVTAVDNTWVGKLWGFEFVRKTNDGLKYPDLSVRPNNNQVFGLEIEFIAPESGYYVFSEYNVHTTPLNKATEYIDFSITTGAITNQNLITLVTHRRPQTSATYVYSNINYSVTAGIYLNKGDVARFKHQPSFREYGDNSIDNGFTIRDISVTMMPHFCSGGTADCQTKANCQYCGEPYGEVSTTNHVTDCTASYTFDATTHTAVWSKCQHKETSVPHDWNESGACADCNYACKHPSNASKATCTDLAVCATCGASHGKLDPNAHYGDPSFNYKKATKTHHYISYSCCGCDYYAEKHVFDDNDNCTICDYGKVFNVPVVEEPDGRPSADPNCKHTGGVATCRTKAVCTKCGGVYGSLDPNNHVSDALDTIVNSKTHSATHTCCGAVAVEETEHTYDNKGKCTGCTYKCSHNKFTEGVCDKCGYEDPNYAPPSDDPIVSDTDVTTTDDTTSEKDKKDNKVVIDTITIAAVASVVLMAIAVVCAIIAVSKAPKKK